MTEKELNEVFREMETELINNMIKTLKYHQNMEIKENFEWTQWQAIQLSKIQEFRKRNKDIIKEYDKRTIKNLESLLKISYKEASEKEQRQLLKAIIKGAKFKPLKHIIKIFERAKGENNKEKARYLLDNGTNFFSVNDEKLRVLIEESRKPIQDAYRQILRYEEDIYRDVVMKAQIYSNVGNKSLYNCIDMATRDFLINGINCITYKNGAKVNIASYSEMCIRTANKKASLIAGSNIRNKFGINTVYLSDIGSCCSICEKWQGKVYIDDVYYNGKGSKYPLLSEAVNSGVFHPNCRHTISTYFEDINSEIEEKTAEEKKAISEVFELEQEQRKNERIIRKYERLYKYSLDEENQRKYELKMIEWKNKNNALVKNSNGLLKRNYWREKNKL